MKSVFYHHQSPLLLNNSSSPSANISATSYDHIPQIPRYLTASRSTMHLPLEVREKLVLLPENPTREELYVLWTNLLQRYFPFPLHGSLPNLPSLPDETEVKYALGNHQESEISHISLAVGREYGPFDRMNFLHVFCHAEPKEEWRLAELQAKLKEEMMKSSHCHIARGRGMTIHGAIVVGRVVQFYKLKHDGLFECMAWLAQGKQGLHILQDMRIIATHLMQISYEVRMRD